MADYGGQSQHQGQGQAPPPPYPYQEQPLQGQKSGDYAPYPQVNRNDDERYGTPVMGAPSNPSAHPDNQSAAMGSFSSRSSGSYRDDSVPTNKAQMGPSVPGQQQGQYGQASPAQGTPSATGGAAGTTSAKGGSMDQFKVQVAEFSKKAELAMNNMWGHLSAGGNPAEAAWGRVTAGTQLLTKGGFEGVFKTTFAPVEADEKLKKTYACFLSTSTGPVAGTLYITNKRLAFCSDRPLSYTPAGGGGAAQATKPGKSGQAGPQQSYSYYKVIVPVNKVKEVIPSVNQSKPAEKYIQIMTQDNFEFWFMGFVNYDKGVKNLQAVLVGGGQQQPTTGVPGQQHPTGIPQHQQQQEQFYDPNQQGQQTYPPNQQQQPYPPNQGQQQQSYPPPNQSYQQAYPPQQGGGGYQHQQSYQGGQGEGGLQHQQSNPQMTNQPSFAPNNYGTAPRYD